MKKMILIFCAVFAALGFMDWNDFEADSTETSVSGDSTIATLLIRNSNAIAMCNLTYGPNQMDESRLPPYLYVPLEKQAAYEGGKDALMEYLKVNSKEARVGMSMDELPPFKLLFTVTKKGTVENARLDGTSGYLSIDLKMVELIAKAPGTWKPAENAKGEKVDQEQMVPFGLTGC